MSGLALSREVLTKMAEALIASAGNVLQAARATGHDRTTYYKKFPGGLKDAEGFLSVKPNGEVEVVEEIPSIKCEEKGDTRKITGTSDREIRTQEDVLRYADVDTNIWRVSKWGCTHWEVVLKIREWDETGKIVGERPERRSLWRVNVELQRIMPEPFLKASEALLERLARHKPDFGPKRPKIAPRRPYMMEISINDHHFGALSWAKETGQDYDLKIAEKLYANAVEDALAKAAHYEIERFLFPVGNDFFHIDSLAQTTTNGTFQDADGRYHKIIETGEMAVINAIDRCLKIAPVDILHVDGNHDRLSSWHLCRVLHHHYRNTPDVTVDTDPAPYKFYRYGVTLLGFVHGDQVSAKDLPMIMATSLPEIWGATKYREWHCGHIHKSKQLSFLTLDTEQNVGVRYIPSLKATDSWHCRKGYLSTNRVSESFLWSKETGLDGIFTSIARLGA